MFCLSYVKSNVVCTSLKLFRQTSDVVEDSISSGLTVYVYESWQYVSVYRWPKMDLES